MNHMENATVDNDEFTTNVNTHDDNITSDNVDVGVGHNPSSPLPLFVPSTLIIMGNCLQQIPIVSLSILQ